jgi:hypothetical protein
MSPGAADCAHVFPCIHPLGVFDASGQTWHDVPTIADLDPTDHRRLPDGSRWVDAEALRRVVIHVAGLEVPR